jgi:hypothetical protein
MFALPLRWVFASSPVIVPDAEGGELGRGFRGEASREEERGREVSSPFVRLSPYYASPGCQAVMAGAAVPAVNPHSALIRNNSPQGQ